MKLVIKKKQIVILLSFILFVIGVFLVIVLLRKGKGQDEMPFLNEVEHRELTEEEYTLLEDLYSNLPASSDSEEEDVQTVSYKLPCELINLKREEKLLEVSCNDSVPEVHSFAPKFVIVCTQWLDTDRGVTPEMLYQRAKEEGDLEVLNNILNYTENNLGMSDKEKFDFIDSQIGNKKLVLRLIGEEGYYGINMIKFVVDDLSVCKF